MTTKKEQPKKIETPTLEWRTNAPEEKFLVGADSLSKEVLRLFRIISEYVKGFIAFRNIHRCVTVFGSARFHQGHPYYEMAYEVGRLLADANYTVMTGGGPGIMEAANRGAKSVNGKSIGCNIQISQEQAPNPYLDKWITFKFFFIRKVMLTKYSLSFVVMPGGFGTLDELFEMETLIQTGKIRNFPVVLMGKDYWSPLIRFMENTLVTQGTIEESDTRKIILTDSPREAVEYIKEFAHTRIKTDE